MDFKKSKNMYEDWKYIINSGFQECIDMGWNKKAASGKTLYDVENALSSQDELEKQIIYFELSYLFAKEEIKEAFEQIYNEWANSPIKLHLSFYNDLIELKDFYEELRIEEKIISDYKISLDL